MKIAFTLCSINYLAQAKTLADSIKKSNPEWLFIIGLVDQNVTNVDLSFLDCEILYADQIEIEGFEQMVNAYSIVELITAVKPFYFIWILKNYIRCDKIIYFDPDIMVFGSLIDIEAKLDSNDIILTPHFTRPITDKLLPTEKHVFNTGVFNLGFLAVKRSENTISMLTWWAEKLRTECILDLTRGYFVDQLWMTLVPAYFDNVLIDKYPGYNMAHWNLHERVLTNKSNGYLVNGLPLVFYHFSHFNPHKPNQIAAYHTRFSFENRPDLIPIFKDYAGNLLKNKYDELRKVPCYYIHNENKKQLKKQLGSFLRRNIPLGVKLKLSRFLGK